MSKVLLGGLALLIVGGGASGCARSSKPAVAPAQATAEAEPIHDTIQEFKKGERIACAAGTDLVYVVSRDGGLHSFDPVGLKFNRIGTLDCPGTRRSLPHSMAVDRSGQAWVGYDNGVLALANITTAECTASRVNVRSARIGQRFGMGFAPTPEGGIGGETLFLTTEPPAQLSADGRFVAKGDSLLARIDDGSNITIAGRFPAALRGLSGELSSRSDGKLFAFFTGDPFQLAEIDPTTADVRSRKALTGMRFSQTGSGSWAFAAVGTEFFFFWADQQSPSTVTRLREDGRIEHVIRDAGIEIVGAGASTCATSSSSAGSSKVATEETNPFGESSKPEPKVAVEPPPPPPQTPPPAGMTVPFSKLPKLPPPNPNPQPKIRPGVKRPPTSPAPVTPPGQPPRRLNTGRIPPFST